MEVLLFIIWKKNCSACSSISLPALEVHFGMMEAAAWKVIFSDWPTYHASWSQILWPPNSEYQKLFAWNTLTSTANHSASTYAMNKLCTYSERSSSSPYFIFLGFNDQWKWRFSTDYVIEYRSSLYLSVDRCMTFECLNLFLHPPGFEEKIQFWYYTVKRFMFYLPKILRSKKMW